MAYHIEVIRVIMYTRTNPHEQCYEEPHYPNESESNGAIFGPNAPEDADECVHCDDLMTL